MGALWDWVTGKTEREGRELDERLDAINAQSEPIYGQEWADQVATNRGRSTRADDYDAEIQDAFIEGAKEGASNVQGAIKSGISGTVGFVTGSIPPVGWLVLIGVGFWYLGGFVWLRGILAKK